MRVVDPQSDFKLEQERRTEKIRRSFDRAANSYDRFAEVQCEVARHLAGIIGANRSADDVSSALELGCGTGLLTLPLVRRYHQAEWTVTDLSPAMLQGCQTKLATGGQLSKVPTFLVEDGQRPSLRGPFDLVCSNLTFQWFEDLASSVGDWVSRLNECGCLVFNLIGSGSFAAWEVEAAGNPLTPRLNRFPTDVEVRETIVQGLDRMKRCGALGRPTTDWNIKLQVDTFTQTHFGLPDFFNTLRRIGANISVSGNANDFGQLKRWLATTSRAPIDLNYNIITVVIDRTGVTDIGARDWH